MSSVGLLCVCWCFFFFKQKTAYEMRISDWSSDVCSSDLSAGLGAGEGDPRRSITIDHLLRMASGRYSDTPGNRTDPLYFGGSTVEETAVHWPLAHVPGSTFRYANNDTLAAVRAIKPRFAAHPPVEFFAKLENGRASWRERVWPEV